MRVLSALRCHGLGEPGAQPASSAWIAVLPRSSAFVLEPSSVRWPFRAGAPVPSVHPEPPTPPPRALSFVI